MSFPSSVYMVVVATDRLDFEEDVRARLDDGWQLQGGVSISFRAAAESYNEPYIIYAQAIVQVKEAAKI